MVEKGPKKTSTKADRPERRRTGGSRHRPDDYLSGHVHVVARLFRKVFDRRVSRFGLTRGQWFAMVWLYVEGAASQTRLAEVMDMDKVTVGGIVRRLEAKGLIDRAVDRTDERRRVIRLSPRAQPLTDALFDEVDRLHDEALAGLDKKDQAALAGLLLKVQENLSGLD